MQVQDTRLDGGRAIVVSRAATEQPDPTEIERLATAAGYEVVAMMTQRRHEDPGTWLGVGKAEDVAAQATAVDADAVVLDGGLSPGQYASLLDILPAGVALVDRYRVVLDIFADDAADRRAALQVHAATLRYELPRLRHVSDESVLNRATEKGSPVLDAERRIDTIESKLAALASDARDRRARRRQAGCCLVAIAGYTNAGKTTLLHRLVDGLVVEESTHRDLHTTATIDDRLFVTLETVSRRGELGGVPVVYTDTVGLIDAIPHDLIASFSTTLDEVAGADVALLVVDATDRPDRIREKVRVSLEALEDPRGTLIPVLNKIDAIDDLGDRMTALQEFGDDVVPVSARDGIGIGRLTDRITDALPTDHGVFSVPTDGDTQAFLSWAHDNGAVETHYERDTVRLEFQARPAVIERARSRIAELDGSKRSQ